MRILDVQQRRRQVGRLRLGTKGPKGEPKRLETWRLTSPHELLIDAAAEQYGGNPQPWGDQWEVITETKTIPVIVPTQDIFTRYELWASGGKQRHCDGNLCEVAVKDGMVEQDCLCDPDQRECKPYTRIKFHLIEIREAFGVWGLTSTGWNVASELAYDAQMVAGRMVPVDLRIEQRESKKKGQPTHRFAVPVLSTSISLAQLMGGGGAGDGTGLTLPTSTVTALPSPLDVVEVLPPMEKGEPTSISTVGEVIEETGAAPLPQVTRGMSNITDMVERVEERAWVDLLVEVESPPSPAATMDTIEVALRSLFRRMGQVGLWPDRDGVDALHQSLRKRGMKHVGDMRKSELVKFTEKAWEAAQSAIKEAE